MTAPYSQPFLTAHAPAAPAAHYGDDGMPAAPLPGPIPCAGDIEDVANDNAQRCRRSGIAIDPMFLN